VAALAFAAAPAAATTPDEALAILNQLRTSTGIPAVQGMDADKNTGCAKHNHYMAVNGTLTHTEESGKPGYTPEGAAAGNQSVLAQPQGDPTIWLDSVFHRIGMFQPRLYRSGFAASEGYTCMWTIKEVSNTTVPSVKTYPWPPNGATSIAPRFTSNESPSPYDVAGVRELGYLLSVNMDGPWFDHYSTHVKVASASLVSDGGSRPSITVVDSQTPYQYNGSQIGVYLPASFALFPHGELKHATTYTAHAQGVVTYQSSTYPFDVTWHFKTAGQAVPGSAKLALAKGELKRKKVKFVLTASKSLLGRKASIAVNGKPRNTIALKASQTIKVKRPAKGKTVKLKVTTAAFTRDGVSYPAASASRTFKRKP
jgi:hypothetical protein